MFELSALAVKTILVRFPNNRYLRLLAFLTADFWGIDDLDTADEIAEKVSAVPLAEFHTLIAQLLAKYSAKHTVQGRDGRELEVPALFSSGSAASTAGAGAADDAVEGAADMETDDEEPEVAVDKDLEGQCAAVQAAVSEWPRVAEKVTRGTGSARGTAGVTWRLATWQDFWGGLVLDPTLQRSAPDVVKLVQILLVQCHGGIDCERSFSGMNSIHFDARNRLGNKHLNVALRMWHERDRLLQNDALFPEMMQALETNGLPR